MKPKCSALGGSNPQNERRGKKHTVRLEKKAPPGLQREESVPRRSWKQRTWHLKERSEVPDLFKRTVLCLKASAGQVPESFGDI